VDLQIARSARLRAPPRDRAPRSQASQIFVTPSDDDPWEIRVIDFGSRSKMQHGGIDVMAWPAGHTAIHGNRAFGGPVRRLRVGRLFAGGDGVCVVTGRYPWGEDHSAFELYRRQLSERRTCATMPPGWEETVLSALSPTRSSDRDRCRSLCIRLQWGSRPTLRTRAGWRFFAGRPAVGLVLANDETLRGTATTGAWRAAISGRLLLRPDRGPRRRRGRGLWDRGPGRVGIVAGGSALWAFERDVSTPSTDASTSILSPGGFVLLAIVAAVLAGFVVYAIVRALEVR